MTKVTKKYWIKERHNPQLDKAYYTLYGQLSKREAVQKENTLYGMNIMKSYATEKEYKEAIEKLKADGFRVTEA